MIKYSLALRPIWQDNPTVTVIADNKKRVTLPANLASDLMFACWAMDNSS